MGKRNRRIFAGFYRRYDSKFVYVVAVVPDADTGGDRRLRMQVLLHDKGILLRNGGGERRTDG